MTSKIYAIENKLHYIAPDELADYWNQYCELNNYPDDKVYIMDEETLLNMFSSKEELVHYMIMSDHFSANDLFFYFTGTGKLLSAMLLDDDGTPYDGTALAMMIDSGDIVTELNNSDLMDEFIRQTDLNSISNEVTDYINDNGYDLVTDDWDDLEKEIKEYLGISK